MPENQHYPPQNNTSRRKIMKMKTLVFTVFLCLMFVMGAAAQDIDTDQLPRYIVVATTNGGVLSNLDVDIRIKKSKYKIELQKLERMLKDDSDIKTYTDLLNRMDELGFDFLDAFENKIQSGILDDAKIRQNLIFRKKGS